MDLAEPPYARIAARIARRIADGDLRAGDRVPSTRQITAEYGVAMATASKALAALRADGLVRPVPGIGTVVADRARPPRRPDPALAADRVVRTAVAIADREGLGGLTMRRLAAELGVATMSVYRHVTDKDELLLLMMDAVMAENPPPDPPPAGWRAQAEAIARLQWAMYRRRPWLAQSMSFTRPVLAPHAMAHTEWTMRAFAGLGPAAAFTAAVTLANHVRGTAVNLETEEQAEQDTGLTDDQWMRERLHVLQSVLAGGRFPHMSAYVGAPGSEDFTLDTLFEFGLQRLLDGLAPLLE